MGVGTTAVSAFAGAKLGAAVGTVLAVQSELLLGLVLALVFL